MAGDNIAERWIVLSAVGELCAGVAPDVDERWIELAAVCEIWTGPAAGVVPDVAER